MAMASATVRTAAPLGRGTPSCSITASKRRRSSARSMLSTEVPRIGAPLAASGPASPIAVCPPNCVTMGGRPEGDLNAEGSASAAVGELNAKFAKDAKGRKEDKESDAAATDATDATDDLTSMTASEAGAFFSPLRD